MRQVLKVSTRKLSLQAAAQPSSVFILLPAENSGIGGGVRRRQYGVSPARAAQGRRAHRLLLRLLPQRRQPRAREQRLRA